MRSPLLFRPILGRPAASVPRLTARQFLGGAGLNILLTVGSAVLTALAFPPTEMWALPWVALVPLFIALRRTTAVRAAGWLALLYGLVFCAIALHWMSSIFSSGAVGVWVLASLPWVVFGLAYRALAGRSPLPVVTLMTPVLWLAVEWIRCEGWYFQFSWLQLGFTQAPWHAGVQFYPLIGVYGVTFLIVLANALLVGLLDLRAGWRARLIPLAVCVVLLGVYAKWVGRGTPYQEQNPLINVRLVQDEESNIDTLAALSTQWTASAPDLTLWPEYAVLDYPLSNPELLARLQSVARDTGSTLVLGCKEEVTDGVRCDWLRRRGMRLMEGKLFYNTALIIGPDGTVLGAYHKTHPIQFFADGVPGRTYPTFETPVGRVGMAICYDFDYAACTRHLVRNGAELLLVPTYDAKLWGKTQHAQHSRMAQARAAEVSRWIVRATTSGHSQLLNPRGELTALIADDLTASRVRQVALRTEMTPYVRYTYLLPYVCCWLGVAWALGYLVGVWRRGGQPRPAAANAIR